MMSPIRPFVAAGLLALVALAPTAQAQFSDDFESLLSAAAGTAVNGQNGWFIPPVASTNDGAAFTYAGNTLSLPANASGGSNFVGATNAGGAFNVRMQHAANFGAPPYAGDMAITFDFCARYNGAVFPAVNNIGSVSLQPSTTGRHFIALATWTPPIPATAAPTQWNADFAYFAGPTGTTQVFASGGNAALGIPADLPACFRGLPVDVWHRWTVKWNWTSNLVTEISIQNLNTGAKHFHRPTNYYLRGGPGNIGASVDTTDVRLFVGGVTAGNTGGFDNLSVGAAAAPAGTGEYDINDASAGMDFNSVLGTNLCAANLTIAQSGTGTANFTATGLAMEVGIGLLPLVPVNEGGIPLPGGDINLNVLDPNLQFLWGGAGPVPTPVPPFSGSFSVPGFPVTIAAQMLSVDPAAAAGYSISQPNQINVP